MKIGVIMGGVSSEREVSLKTGKEMAKALDRSKYEVVEIIIDKKTDLMDKVREEKIDFALLALHGAFGEDGGAQGILEAMEIPYSGCGILASALCMDKDATKKVAVGSNIRTAKWRLVKAVDEIKKEDILDMGFPLVVKPVAGGSSLGTFLVKDEIKLKEALEEAFKFDKKVMVEEYVKGEEITCPVLGGEILPILSIKPKNEFFDFESKYEDGGALEEAAILSKELEEKVIQMTKEVVRALDCEVYSRVDMIIKDDEPYLLEVNTLPGMTQNSLVPRSANIMGLTFDKLLDKIIEVSLNERG